MKRKKLLLIVFMAALILGLSSCKKEKLYTVEFYNGDEVFKTMENLKENSILPLPVLEEEGYVFAGWESSDLLYSEDLIVTESLTLTAVFEEIEDVFTCVKQEDVEFELEGCYITNYSGRAVHLIIPQYVGGEVVLAITTESFSDSEVISITLPLDVAIGIDAFNGNDTLKEVYFYGEHLVPVEKHMSGSEYLSIIEGYQDVCEVIESTVFGDNWELTEGCPIIKVKGKSNSVFIDGVEYYSYLVEIDKNLLPQTFQSNMYLGSFRGAEAIDTVEIPTSTTWLQSDVFMECPTIKNIIVDENHSTFTVEDGVLFDKDKKTLVFYPNGLENTTYTVPGFVETVMSDAFLGNSYLEEIIISEEFIGQFEVNGLHSLKRFIVEVGNDMYYVVDDVLYSRYEFGDYDDGNILVRYPSSKEGSSFVVPNDISIIGSFAFSYNKNLNEIDLGTTLLIDSYAFSYTEKINEITIPSTVEFMTFAVTARSSIDTVILERSFVVDGSITYTQGSLYFDSEDYKIYVPDDSVGEYISDVSWSHHSDNIKPISEYE